MTNAHVVFYACYLNKHDYSLYQFQWQYNKHGLSALHADAIRCWNIPEIVHKPFAFDLALPWHVEPTRL
jgi:hypothetical protein